jgi:competence protein ComEA
MIQMLRGVLVPTVVNVVAFGRCFQFTRAVFWGLIFCVASSLSVVTALGQQQAQQPQQKEHEQQQHVELPAGPGKDTLIRACSRCHSPSNVIANGRNREGWEELITKMVGLGAVGTDEDFTEILDYLVKNFPQQSNVKINVNKATAKELETGLVLSAKESEGIVTYREKNGGFKSLDDLKKVPGLDAQKIDLKKNRLTF